MSFVLPTATLPNVARKPINTATVLTLRFRQLYRKVGWDNLSELGENVLFRGRGIQLWDK